MSVCMRAHARLSLRQHPASLSWAPQVVVRTSDIKGAGTDSKVTINIVGEKEGQVSSARGCGEVWQEHWRWWPCAGVEQLNV